MTKVNLLIDNPNGVRSGYINIDPFAADDDAVGRVKGDISHLSHTIDDGEASEIIAHDILGHYSGSVADAVLNHWLTKLARGGTLSISMVDFNEVVRAYMANELSLEEANELIHGKQEKDWQFYKSTFTQQIARAVLENKGLKILSCRISNYRTTITAERTQ